MSRVQSISVVFVAVSVSSCAVHGREKPDSIAQHFAGNAELRPALRAPGMDTRAGETLCDGHPVGSCASSASTGADETSHPLAVGTQICTNTASGFLSVSI